MICPKHIEEVASAPKSTMDVVFAQFVNALQLKYYMKPPLTAKRLKFVSLVTPVSRLPLNK
jgi:hypothetical protein